MLMFGQSIEVTGAIMIQVGQQRFDIAESIGYVGDFDKWANSIQHNVRFLFLFTWVQYD